MKNLDKNRIVVGMSGGVDSSVSVYLLQKQGFEVIGVTLNHNKEKSMIKEIEDARNIAKKFGIKHIVVDMEDIFQKVVIDNFIEGYSNGITPSPCVICDERVKIKLLLDVANSEGAYYIGTGHYAKIEKNEEFNQPLLKIATDRKKDQSYMLYRIESKNLERVIFPLYKYNKTEIREIAKEIGLQVFDKKDSQGICFAKEGYIEFLKNNLKDKIKIGEFVDRDGKVMGYHQGYQLYTIGQRRGLNLKLPRPYFITNIIPKENKIVLGDYEELKRKKIELSDYKEIVKIEKIIGLELIGRPRYSSNGASGKILLEDGKIYFEYFEDNFQNAPGQHLVLYYKDFVVGGGMINYLFTSR